MRSKLLFFVIGILVLSATSAFGQKAAAADSLWCNNLNNIIRCASLDLIVEPVAKDIRDSSYISSLLPRTRLSQSAVELIGKQNGKVTYMCYLYSTGMPNQNLQAQFNKWYKKLKGCLSLWEDAELPNGDKSLMEYKDRFFTNSEDETTVRLDIVKTDGYHVRLRIY